MDERLRPAATLLDDEELARLTERARLDAQTGVKGAPLDEDVELSDDEEDAARARDHALFVRGLTGLRLAARTYALRGDPAGLTPVVWGGWALTARRFDPWLDPHAAIAAAVASAGARLLEVPGLAERLARSHMREVRLALAKALPGSAEAVLRALATDDDAAVRAAAGEKVALDDAWGGAFPISPAGHPEDVLEAARAVLDMSPYDLVREPDRIEPALAPLADPLAVACWERLLASEHATPEVWRPWLARLVERPGGGAALARLVERWRTGGRGLRHAIWLSDAQALGLDARARAIGEILARIRALEVEDASGSEVTRFELAETVVLLAPERGDTRALLETILGAPIDRAHEGPSSHLYDAAANVLSPLLARWPLDPVVHAALWRERREGKRGRWRRVVNEGWAALGPDPVLRQKAWRDLDAGDEGLYARAVAALLGEHRDPEGEPADELARRLYARPELRHIVLAFSKAPLPEARRDLEAGLLDLPTAHRVLMMTRPEEQTDAMWASARALRERALAADDDARELALDGCKHLVRAGDAWDPSDLAYARAAAEIALASEENAFLLEQLVLAILAVDAPESAGLLGEIEARATSEEHVDCFRSAMERGGAARG